MYYSGKKKQHTVKNVLVIDGDGHMCSLSMTYAGKWHDKRIADDDEYQLPAASILYQDMGFQGFAVSGSVLMQPKQKPRGGELTSEEQEENRRINAIRVRIEHVIGSVKRYRIVKDKLRLWRERIHDMVMETCCGLHNFRLQYRPWVYQLCNES